MSIVVAYKRDGIVYMGADTQTTRGSGIIRSLNEGGFKISRLANGMLLGICGLVKGHQRILANKKLFEVPRRETFDKRYIVRNIVPALSEMMKDVNEERSSCNSSMSMQILIGYQGNLFYISRDFEVLVCDRYAAIGAAEDYAVYALSQIGEGDVNEGLLKAMRVGAQCDNSVSAPFVLIDSKTKEFKIVED